ncbi:MAG: hypothetical protein DGJ47_000151 [Rickettsiaceae bacterium]
MAISDLLSNNYKKKESSTKEAAINSKNPLEKHSSYESTPRRKSAADVSNKLECGDKIKTQRSKSIAEENPSVFSKLISYPKLLYCEYIKKHERLDKVDKHSIKDLSKDLPKPFSKGITIPQIEVEANTEQNQPSEVKSTRFRSSLEKSSHRSQQSKYLSHHHDSTYSSPRRKSATEVDAEGYSKYARDHHSHKSHHHDSSHSSHRRKSTADIDIEGYSKYARDHHSHKSHHHDSAHSSHRRKSATEVDAEGYSKYARDHHSHKSYHHDSAHSSHRRKSATEVDAEGYSKYARDHHSHKSHHYDSAHSSPRRKSATEVDAEGYSKYARDHHSHKSYHHDSAHSSPRRKSTADIDLEGYSKHVKSHNSYHHDSAHSSHRKKSIQNIDQASLTKFNKLIAQPEFLSSAQGKHNKQKHDSFDERKLFNTTKHPDYEHNTFDSIKSHSHKSAKNIWAINDSKSKSSTLKFQAQESDSMYSALNILKDLKSGSGPIAEILQLNGSYEWEEAHDNL